MEMSQTKRKWNTAVSLFNNSLYGWQVGWERFLLLQYELLWSAHFRGFGFEEFAQTHVLFLHVVHSRWFLFLGEHRRQVLVVNLELEFLSHIFL